MFRNTGANAFAKNQMRLAYEDKRDLYCMSSEPVALGCAARYATEEVGLPLNPLISDSMNYLMTNQLLKNLSEMMDKYEL